ncbi:putative membrane protein [Rhodopirellula maiorica SM1]|uniref:Putative membrane protein n=1 Tax=Rhodopirellula maiorica SM1 TaxID=1265738 RepID=M5RCJ1_9BACT|nr:hypothetical protein [Rhodopirellula maiorica]EMI17100.1 putative membrane protein [Rhodopirellula maiorica SM1]
MGKVTQEGVYTAPSWIWRPRTVVLTARSRNEPQRFAHATITLLDTPLKRLSLGIYLSLMGAVLIASIILMWGHLYSPAETPQVIVSPPMATLKPEEKLSFSASVAGTVDDDVTAFRWSKTKNEITDNGSLDDVTGVYTAPAEFSKTEHVVVTAKSVDESGSSGTAVVIISDSKQLQVLPSVITARASQVIPFATATEVGSNKSEETSESDLNSSSSKITWDIEPKVGRISEQGVYQAPAKIEETQTVTVIAQIKEDDSIRAAANVILIASVESGASHKRDILIFVLLMGAFGSLLHSVASFTAFVGNRQFSPSWCWWYLFQPCIGAGLALIVFFVVGRGHIAGESVDNLFGIAMIAALVGLFSDQATLKLKELVETILTTKNADRRTERLQPDAAKPVITEITPPTIKHGMTPPPTLEISGTHFVTGCKVKVNGSLRDPTSVASTKVTVGLTTADVAKARKLSIVVINPNNESSGEVTVEVT